MNSELDQKNMLNMFSDSLVPNELNRFEYDPNLIADFEYDKNFRRTTLKFNCYVTSILHFGATDDMKKLLNENFVEQYPFVQITYSKIKSIEYELLKLAHFCDFDDIVVAYAYVFFEKLIFKVFKFFGIIKKPNRKLIAGAALLIAAKITDFGTVRVSKVVEVG
ncbi:unnamed protein product [Dracunculus medinensis]|uniref:Cyclin N-terminal domain-containing protein n=1 Tax=Dracunculus medinensis TaxID=318479 RepID=A0A3P7S9R1_DRAME|nr:unnamed protein product [Dracunculus medinensis]